MVRPIVFCLIALSFGAIAQKKDVDPKWIPLFNGKDLNDWKIKIAGYPLDENYGNTFRVAEVIVDALLKAGYSEQEAARLCWALVYFTLGLTQEQQTSPPDADAAGVDFAEASYPALAKVGVQLLVHDSFDARFDYGLARLLNVA